MKYLLMILIFGCSTTKTFILDGSKSEGNIVKWEWKVNNEKLGSDSVKTTMRLKKPVMIELIVTDNAGRKDTAVLRIK